MKWRFSCFIFKRPSMWTSHNKQFRKSLFIESFFSRHRRLALASFGKIQAGTRTFIVYWRTIEINLIKTSFKFHLVNHFWSNQRRFLRFLWNENNRIHWLRCLSCLVIKTNSWISSGCDGRFFCEKAKAHVARIDQLDCFARFQTFWNNRGAGHLVFSIRTGSRPLKNAAKCILLKK